MKGKRGKGWRNRSAVKNHSAFPKDLSSIPSIHIRGAQASVTLVPEDLRTLASVGTCTLCVHRPTCRQTHDILKIKKMEGTGIPHRGILVMLVLVLRAHGVCLWDIVCPMRSPFMNTPQKLMMIIFLQKLRINKMA